MAPHARMLKLAARCVLHRSTAQRALGDRLRHCRCLSRYVMGTVAGRKGDSPLGSLGPCGTTSFTILTALELRKWIPVGF